MKNGLTLAILVAVASQGHAATVTQSATAPGGTDWDSSSIWSDGSVPAPANTYFTATGLAASGGPDISQASPALSSTAYTDTIRALGTTFSGGSLTIVGNTRLLVKSGASTISTGNIILANNGNIVNGDGGTADTLAGSIQVGSLATDSGFLFSNNTANGVFTVSANLTGLGILNLGAEQYTGFLSGVALTGNDNSFGGTLNYFTPGVFTIGSLTDPLAAMDFSSTTLGSTGSSFSSSNNLVVGSLDLGSTVVGAGTYTGAQLDLLGSTTIFTTDADTITVAPEPSLCVLLVGGVLALLGVKRIFRHSNIFSS